jgi:hypothetical protein
MKTVPRLEKHLVVVAQDRNQAALTGKRDQPFQDAPAVRTAVNVIAKRDDDVVGLGSIAPRIAFRARRQP